MSAIKSRPAQHHLFFKRLVKGNAERAKLLAYIAILLELIVIGRSVIVNGFVMNIYVYLYITMLVASILVLVVLKRIERMQQSDQQLRARHWTLLLYYSFFLYWGVVVTLLDQPSYGHITAYLTNFMAVCVLFISDRKTFIYLHITPTVLLIVGFFLYQPQADIIWAHIINLSFFYVFSVAGTRQMYLTLQKMFYQELQLCEKNQQLEKWSAHVQQLAIEDELTKIPNRRGLYTHIATVVSYGRVNMTVMLLDLDAFKSYNDYYGHAAGDRVLHQVAQCLEQLVGKHGHFVGRYGGEEFVIVAVDLTPQQSQSLAESVRQAIIAQRIVHERSPIAGYLTASIGYTRQSIEAIEQFDQLLEQADQALYTVKRTTRNRVASY